MIGAFGFRSIMNSRPRLRASDIKTVLNALRTSGLEPVSLDILPDGTYRWNLKPPADDDEAELDRELAEWSKKHGL